MDSTRSDFLWAASNAGADPILLWLEPWAEEFELLPRSSVILRTPAGQPVGSPESVEQTPDHIAIWMGGGNAEVCIDGAPQDSASAMISVPAGLSKQMLEVVFAAQPAARLGGAPDSTTPQSWWLRVRRFFGT